ncbi:MAG: hypothetical protein R2867_05485 [Caldilineaceae bacterium]
MLEHCQRHSTGEWNTILPLSSINNLFQQESFMYNICISIPTDWLRSIRLAVLNWIERALLNAWSATRTAIRNSEVNS